ncbi:MAG: excisionase family DNA-binding protein [Acidimicrobiales bacterium]
MTEKVLLTVEEAAERLSIGRTKAFELIAKGELESVMIGRARRVPVQALEPFVAALREESKARHPSAIMQGGWSRTPPADAEAAAADEYAGSGNCFDRTR